VIYRRTVVAHESPDEILPELAQIETETEKGMTALKSLLETPAVESQVLSNEHHRKCGRSAGARGAEGDAD
jgi:hypothetical protein